MLQISAQSNKRVVLDDVSLAPLEAVEIDASDSKLYSTSQLDYTLDISTLAGIWRGVFQIKENVEVPFLFQIKKNGVDWTAELLNGEEKFQTGPITSKDDSIFVSLPLFENELALSFKNNQLVGSLRKVDLTGIPIPLKAVLGGNFRFVENGSSPLKDISGKYKVYFKNAKTGQDEESVGLFKQVGNKLTATFLRVTGDSRYLEGIIQDNSIQLSAFIGTFPAYYKASVDQNGLIRGEVIGIKGNTAFTAIPDSGAELPDAYTLTHLKEGNTAIQFSFSDGNNKLVSSNDTKFSGKPLIITIGGTWCPNCMDEAAFLGPWYQKNKQRGIEIVALQYERQTDPAYVKKAFDRFKKQFDISYTLLLGGTADKQVVVNSLPALENFISFPTTIFVGKDGLVKKIHTGFSGPATGKNYTDFIAEFNKVVDDLLR